MDHHNKRVLLVEDDPMVGMILAEMLEDADFDVDGPYANVRDAVAAVADHIPDCAVLDVRLDDREDVYLVADDLDQYGVPFVLCSGASPGGRVAEHFPDAPFVPKERAAFRLIPALDRILH